MIWNKKPFAWEQDRLGNVAKITMGTSPDGSTYSETPKNYILIQGNADLKDGWVYPRVWTTQITKTVDADDLIMSVRAPAGAMGKSAYNAVIGREVAGIKGNEFIFQTLVKYYDNGYWSKISVGSTFDSLNSNNLKEAEIMIPSNKEQEKIGRLFSQLDSLVALHQRKQKGEKMFKKNNRKKELFWEYYEDWVKVYKEGAVRNVTLRKYHLTLSWLKRIIPDLRIKDLTRVEYQELINRFAECHEKQTTMDFHHHLNAAIEDAIDEGLIEKNPTRKAIIKGKTPRPKKPKYLNQYELHSLLGKLELKDKPSMDWLVLLIAKTGIRFSEAIAVTPADFDFVHQTLTINKTWDYKENGGFQPTKNKSSIRKIQIDWMVVSQFSNLVKDLHPEKPIFVTKEKIYNSTANDLLEKRCKQAGVPVISIHGLRHTHASILLFAGVSVASVAKRLGHSTMTTTEKVYLHIIQELENKDIDLVMRSLSGLI